MASKKKKGKSRPWFLDPITLLLRLIIGEMTFGVVSLVVLMSGALNPVFYWLAESDLSTRGDEWVSEVTGLKGANIQDVEFTVTDMQGGGSQKVALKLNIDQIHRLVEQLDQNEQWQKRSILLCDDPDKSPCGNPEFACYTYSSISEASATRTDREFCANDGVFRLQQSYW